jgi:hypothetical protein
MSYRSARAALELIFGGPSRHESPEQEEGDELAEEEPETEQKVKDRTSVYVKALEGMSLGLCLRNVCNIYMSDVVETVCQYEDHLLIQEEWTMFHRFANLPCALLLHFFSEASNPSFRCRPFCHLEVDSPKGRLATALWHDQAAKRDWR